MASVARFDTWQAADGTNVARFSGGELQVWNGSAWGPAGTPWATIDETPTGTYNDGTFDWNYWIYKSNGTLTVTQGGLVEYLVVAGGASGAVSNTANDVGAGGGGGVLESCDGGTIDAGSYAITIGAGGATNSGTERAGNNGSNSSIGSLAIAIGGGAGQYRLTAGNSGGCGGGAGDAYTGTYESFPGDPTLGQGFRGGGGRATGGGAGGGAGGPGAHGSTTANGGVGRTTTIITTTIATAESVGEVSGGLLYFAGGGGSSPGSLGGLGGGQPGAPIDQRGTNAPANTGGGTGNADVNQGAPYAGVGGSGVVIVRTKA